MYPRERHLVEPYKDRPFELLGVNCEDRTRFIQTVRRGDVTWRNWSDGANGRVARRWQVESYPTIYLIDHKGIISIQKSTRTATRGGSQVACRSG